MKPKIALVHFSPNYQEKSKEAQRLRQRFVYVSNLKNIEVACLEANALTKKKLPKSYIYNCLKNCCAIWWFGHLVFHEELSQLWDTLQNYLCDFNLTIPIFDTPKNIESIFNLAIYYPKFLQKVPQAQTTFIHTQGKVTQQQLRDLLSKISIGKNGVFFRTFYGTQKISPYMNMAFSSEDLLRGCDHMITALEKTQDIGGIAIREMLPISIKYDDLLGSKWRLEYRIFIVDKQPVLWIWNGDIESEKRRIKCSQLQEISLKQAPVVFEYAKIIGHNLDARLIVADFALLENDSIVLLEINPGYCAGWQHNIAFSVYKKLLSNMAGLSLSIEDCSDDLEQWGKNCVWGFF